MRRTSIGYVFQDFNLIPALTAAENVALPRELDGERTRAARRRRPGRPRGGRHRRARRPVPRRDVRRAAAAGRDRPRHRRRAPADPGRRADRRPRHRDRRGHPAPAARPLRRGRGRASWSPTRRGTPPGPTGWSSCATASSSTSPAPTRSTSCSSRAPGERLERRLAGWRPALRLARRDALRARGPQRAGAGDDRAAGARGHRRRRGAADRSDVSGAESLDRRLGRRRGAGRPSSRASARVAPGPRPRRRVRRRTGRRTAAGDPTGPSGSARCSGPTAGRSGCATGTRQRRHRPGRGLRGRPTRGRPARPAGRRALRADHRPRCRARADEVVVNQRARRPRASASATALERAAATGPSTVVGIGESTTVPRLPRRSSARSARPRASGSAVRHADLAGRRRARLVGRRCARSTRSAALVLSRAVIERPAAGVRDARARSAARQPGRRQPTVAVVVLIVVMALIEVVLLAGPAFAVGARRQSRSLALMAATGGTPDAGAPRGAGRRRRARRGRRRCSGRCSASRSAWLLMPLVQRFSGTWFGPFEVPWPHLVGIAAFGLVSALLAAVVPAWIASRQDVVAVLAGRRGDRAPSLRSPVLGRRAARRRRRAARRTARAPTPERRSTSSPAPRSSPCSA